ncbi:hypothetical protein OEZ86_011427 [Tetradesmus obliquus]|nr:hypothetical protein OEZ86_011427 [Tetradesmus obliquus]
MGLASASCPAQLHPAAEAPATAASANGIAATNNTQHMIAQQIHSGSTEGSRNAGSDSQGAEQQCRGNGDCNWQTCIVRFAEYKMLSEHKQALGKALAHLQQHWAWLERPNKAALQHPSDFALLSVAPLQLQVLRAALQQAGKLWDQGYSGKGIKVGVFDTGIREGHPHIRHIKERTNWTHQQSLSDGLGHGSFVAGVIGSQDTTCPGFAPDVELYTFKVFTDDQVSYTSWFLDAFNYAISCKLHVINLSIGGPDFLDAPFVEKVWEVTSNGLIMISAIGNDGPLYGTLNNPADQPDVIGVGGIDNDNNIAAFSSRGMTTWELPAGTGRIKPDVMAYAKDVTGSKITTGCRSLSGTSVASPVVAGAVCLLASTLPEERRWLLNPASMKQALVEGAFRLPQLNMHEQGNGRINLPASQAILANYTPRASLIPPAIHLADCPYMWPHCKQPLYAHALPVVLNATVVNGMANTGYFAGPPVYEGLDEGGKMLHVTFQYSEVLWPWSGYLAVYVQVSPAAEAFSGNATGRITFTITSPGQLGAESKDPQSSKVVVPLSAVIKPTPPREQRIVWDVLHSIKYPPGYVPRDNLDIKSDVLDWHGDHPYTNFHEAYDALRGAGFSVELLASPASCFDPRNYGGYLVLDAEEEWYKEEVAALTSAVKEHGMALVVFAEWYHEESLKQMKFFDDNTRSWWTPITGGSNVPALNELLAPHGISLGERILQGSTSLGKHTLQVAYGSNIATFPAGGHLHVSHLTDVAGKGAGVPGNYAAFGVAPSGSGKVAVFSDTNCLDSSHNTGPCFEFLVALFQQLLLGKDAGLTPADKLQAAPFRAAGFTAAPQRRADPVEEQQEQQQQAAAKEAEKLQQLADDANKQQQQQQQQQPDKASSSAAGGQGHHAQHFAKEQEQAQQGQRSAFISQAVTLATFICVAGVIGIVVLWSMRSSSNGAGRGKWGRRWGYAQVGRRSPSPLDV